MFRQKSAFKSCRTLPYQAQLFPLDYDARKLVVLQNLSFALLPYLVPLLRMRAEYTKYSKCTNHSIQAITKPLMPHLIWHSISLFMFLK